MSKFIWAPLTLLIIIAISVQMINFQTPLSGTYTSDTSGNPNNEQASALGNIFSVSLVLVATTGFLTLFVGMIVLGVLMGLNISVFGSTVQISARAQKILFNGLFYGGLWGLFSVLATVGVNGIGLFSLPMIGIIFYLIISLFYVLGINSEINKGA